MNGWYARAEYSVKSFSDKQKQFFSRLVKGHNKDELTGNKKKPLKPAYDFLCPHFVSVCAVDVY